MNKTGGILQYRITWRNIMHADLNWVLFLVQAVHEVWWKSETPSCTLCSGRGSLEHLLSSFPKALGDSHTKVLKAEAGSLSHQYQQTPSSQVDLWKQLKLSGHTVKISLNHHLWGLKTAGTARGRSKSRQKTLFVYFTLCFCFLIFLCIHCSIMYFILLLSESLKGAFK